MKVALLLSGHARTYKDTAASIIENIIKPFEADVFIHTWDLTETAGEIWREEKSPIEKTDIDFIKAKFKPIRYIVSDHPITESKTYEDGINKLSTHRMLQSTFYATSLMDDYCRETGVEYDVVIRCRFDLIINTKFKLVDDVKDNIIYTAYNANNTGYQAMLNLYYGTAESMNVLASIIYYPEYMGNHFDKPDGGWLKYINDSKMQTEKIDFLYNKDWAMLRALNNGTLGFKS